LVLLRHLAQFRTLDYQSCLRLLNNSGDKTAASYEFRPLTKQKYISKRENSVTLLAKGKALFPDVTPLVNFGDGDVEWQLRAERSLFYTHWGEDYPTHATGLLLICDEDKRIEVARKIIRETMWRRRQLIDYESYDERTRPVKYSRSPIRIAWYYERVYLTTPNTVMDSLDRIEQEEELIGKFRNSSDYIFNDSKNGDFYSNSRRYFANISTDLLKYVYFLTSAKSGGKKNIAVILQTENVPIMEMYPDLFHTKGVDIYEYRKPEDTVSN